MRNGICRSVFVPRLPRDPTPPLEPPLDYFQYYFSACPELKDVTRFPFYIFSRPSLLEGGFVPGVGRKSGRSSCNSLLFFSSKHHPSFDVPLPYVPVNYTLTNFAFIRGLLIHEVSRTVTRGPRPSSTISPRLGILYERKGVLDEKIKRFSISRGNAYFPGK